MRRVRTADQARGKWPAILQKLGIDSQYLVNKHGPCPKCHGKDRFRFDDQEGRGTWICTQCGAGDGFKLLENVHGWRFARAAREVDQVIDLVRRVPLTVKNNSAFDLEKMRQTWRSSRAVVKGDPVWLYLNARLGVETIPSDIRFYPTLKHSEGGSYPAMLALMRYPDGRAASLHYTYLSEEGKKAPVETVRKFMQGSDLKTASIWLGEVQEKVGIAEGIETALAAAKRFGLSFFAAGTAGLLSEWVPPPGVESVLIAADNDNNFVGQAAAYSLARRLYRDGYEVQIKMPNSVGKDWADEKPK